MNLYIKMVDGKPEGFPLLEENLFQVYGVGNITPSFLEEHGYAPFEKIVVPENLKVVEDQGVELCDDGVVRAKLVTEELTREEKLDLWVRRQRDYLLATTDWTQMADSPLTSAKKAEWAAYRQALRDITDTIGTLNSPSDVVMPEPPAK